MPGHSQKCSILFSLWAIASAAVNPVTVWSRDNYKCCLHIAAAHLVLKRWCWEVYGARCEKGATCPESSRRGKESIWLVFSQEWDHWGSPGAGIGSCGCECWQDCAPCGSVEKHCFLLTVTHGHTHANMHLLANFLQAADMVYGGV